MSTLFPPPLPSDSEPEWYYLVDSEKVVGPIFKVDLDGLFRQGIVSATTLVFKQGSPNWSTYEEASSTPLLPPPLSQQTSLERSIKSSSDFLIQQIRKNPNFILVGAISVPFIFLFGILAFIGLLTSELSSAPASRQMKKQDSVTQNPQVALAATSTPSERDITQTPLSKAALVEEAKKRIEKMRNLLSKAETAIIAASKDPYERENFPRTVRKLNIEASETRDSIAALLQQTDSTDPDFSPSGKVGRPMSNASIAVCEIARAMIARNDSDYELQSRQADIWLTQAEENLKSNQEPKQENFDKNEAAKSVFEQAMRSQNSEESRRLCRKSADMGYWEAQVMYGNILAADRQWSDAIVYLTKAAEQGSLDAMNNLGYMYSGATGMKPNLGEALKWYRIGEIICLEPTPNVGFLEKQMLAGQIENAEQAALQWTTEHPGIKRAIP